MYRVLLSSNSLKLTFPVYQVLSFLRFSTGSSKSKDFPLELDPSPPLLAVVLRPMMIEVIKQINLLKICKNEGW